MNEKRCNFQRDADPIYSKAQAVTSKQQCPDNKLGSRPQFTFFDVKKLTIPAQFDRALEAYKDKRRKGYFLF